MTGEVADSLNLPLTILAPSHYTEELNSLFGNLTSEGEVIQLGENVIGGVLEYVTDRDHLLLSTMASTERFAKGEEKLPETLLSKFPGSISFFHHP